MMEWFDIVNLVAVIFIGIGNILNTFLATKKPADVKVAKKLAKLQNKEAKLVEAYSELHKNN